MLTLSAKRGEPKTASTQAAKPPSVHLYLQSYRAAFIHCNCHQQCLKFVQWMNNKRKLSTCPTISSPAFRVYSSSDSTIGKSTSSNAHNLDTCTKRNSINPKLNRNTEISTSRNASLRGARTSRKLSKSQVRIRISSGGKSRVPRGGSVVIRPLMFDFSLAAATAGLLVAKARIARGRTVRREIQMSIG